MRSGKCPKCESDEIYVRKPSWYAKNTIVIDRKKQRLSTPISALNVAILRAISRKEMT